MHLYKTQDHKRLRALLISALVFVLIIAGVWLLFSGAASRSGEEQSKLLSDALMRATVTCYAIEGNYPPSVDYIKEHYGVVVDDDKFIVSYQVFAQNVLPSISVLEKGVDGSGDAANFPGQS